MDKNNIYPNEWRQMLTFAECPKILTKKQTCVWYRHKRAYTYSHELFYKYISTIV